MNYRLKVGVEFEVDGCSLDSYTEKNRFGYVSRPRQYGLLVGAVFLIFYLLYIFDAVHALTDVGARWWAIGTLMKELVLAIFSG